MPVNLGFWLTVDFWSIMLNLLYAWSAYTESQHFSTRLWLLTHVGGLHWTPPPCSLIFFTEFTPGSIASPRTSATTEHTLFPLTLLCFSSSDHTFSPRCLCPGIKTKALWKGKSNESTWKERSWIKELSAPYGIETIRRKWGFGVWLPRQCASFPSITWHPQLIIKLHGDRDFVF